MWIWGVDRCVLGRWSPYSDETLSCTKVTYPHIHTVHLLRWSQTLNLLIASFLPYPNWDEERMLNLLTLWYYNLTILSMLKFPHGTSTLIKVKAWTQRSTWQMAKISKKVSIFWPLNSRTLRWPFIRSTSKMATVRGFFLVCDDFFIFHSSNDCSQASLPVTFP